MTLSRSIIDTLRYSNFFSYPLKENEIYSRLIKSTCSKREFKVVLNSLLLKGKIVKSGNFFYLPGRENLISLRRAREESSLSLHKKARSLAKQINKISGVLAIYLTGSLAVNNSQEDDDIDLLIVTHRGKLWTTRLLLTLYTSYKGLRRTPKSNFHAGKLCLNLYLTPDSYSLPTSKRTLYSAYELIQAIPLFDPHGTYHDLLSNNPWISKYLPNYKLVSHNSLPNLTTPTNYSIFERFAYFSQLLYMKNKITREYITPDSAFFHPRDPARTISRRLSLLK